MRERKRIGRRQFERWLVGQGIGRRGPLRARFGLWLARRAVWLGCLFLALLAASVALLFLAGGFYLADPPVCRLLTRAAEVLMLGALLAVAPALVVAQRRITAAARPISRLPGVIADADGLLLGDLAPRRVRWHDLVHLRVGADWKVYLRYGEFRLDPRDPEHQRIRRVIDTILERRARVWLLPDEPDPRAANVPRAALSRARAGEEKPARGLSRTPEATPPVRPGD